MLTIASGLALACVAIAVSSASLFESQALHNLSILAGILATNSAAALAFDDAEAATELLRGLATDPAIISARIDDAKGRVFARLAPSVPPGGSSSNPDGQGEIFPSEDLLVVSRPIVLRDRALGAIEIRARRSTLRKVLVVQLVFIVTAGCAALGAAALLCVVLLRRSLAPIGMLSEATRTIAAGDLSQRVSVEGTDEIGELAASFNAMIGRLESTRAEIVRARDYLEGIFSAMSDGLVVVRPDGIVDSLNRSLIVLSAYGSERELVGKPLALLFPELAPGGPGGLWTEWLGRGSVEGHEVLLKTRDGSVVPMAFRGSSAHDPHEQVPRLVGLARDLRETKRLIEEAASARAHREKAGELQRAYDELATREAQLIQAAKLSSLGELAAGIAHELNQPAAAVQGLAQLMRADQDTSVGAYRLEIERIIEATHRMTKIIKNILVFARESRFDPERLDACEALERALMLISEHLSQGGIRVVREFESNLPRIRGDRVLLQQVFLNLLTNARDALLSASDRDVREIVLSARRHERSVLYTIEDNGPGVPPENAGRLFDPFFTTKPPGRGTGLGLSVSYGIVRSHGGEIRFEPRDTGGACFSLSIPMEATPDAETVLGLTPDTVPISPVMVQKGKDPKGVM